MSDPRILKFNTIAGKPPVSYEEGAEKFWESVSNQGKRVFEEAKEILEAIENRDIGKLLDGWVDVWFTNEYLEDLLRAVQINTVQAKNIVCENNLSKFSTNENYMEDCARLMEGVSVRKVEYEGTTYFALIRDSDGKVMKPLDYKEPKLHQTIPASLWSYGKGGDVGCKEL